MAKADTSERIAYGEDRYAWLADQIALLQAGRWRELDIGHLTDELKDLGSMTRREISSRLTVLLQHLLKWQFQPDKRTNSWRATILEQRSRINDDISESPSLRRYPSEILDKEYEYARLRAADETGLALDRFPDHCPYSAAQVLDDEFWPDEARR
jgi:hypothetical protein